MNEKKQGIMRLMFTLALLLFGNHFLWAQQNISNQFFSQRKNTPPVQKKINYNGQWRGGFNETSLTYPGEYNTVYVLELTTEGSRVFGHSYTYFNQGGKKYYTICRLTGTLDRKTNEIEVTEIERTKYNTPPEMDNCFQTHRLRYERDENNTEILRGTWIPAPNQLGNCGHGITVLSRRVESQSPFGVSPQKKQPDVAATAPKKTTPRPPTVRTIPKPAPPVAKKDPAPSPQTSTSKVSPEKMHSEKAIGTIKSTAPLPHKKLESRRTDIVKTISIEQPVFQLDFYDNGEIDGDSISVFYNGKLVLSNQRLTDKPITVKLELDNTQTENVVTMYADNLGTIPPNTAVMIVTDGTKRYVVRLTSDTEKSGSVVFKAAK